jgi:predicted chitinase
MRPRDNPGNPSLIDGLRQVNATVQVVQTAWRHFTAQQEIGGRSALSAQQLWIARCLLTEAIEDWAMAMGRLLALSRGESGLARLSENLEYSLRCAATYLSTLAVIDDPAAPPDLRIISQ